MKFKDVYGDLSGTVYDGIFDCHNNNLTSLEGSPYAKSFHSDFSKDEYIKTNNPEYLI